MSCWEEEGWVDSVLARIAPQTPSEASEVVPGTLWSSRTSGRRGEVLWVSNGRVCLEFAPGRRSHPKLEEFLRNYEQT